MNAANFHEYLKNPSMLHQVNYQELKSLSLQYPYAANLRYLMLVKSLMDNKREYDRNLVLASLSSVDRKKLRQLVMQYKVDSESLNNYEIAEEFLELKDLSSLEEVLEAGPTNSENLKHQTAPLDKIGSESPIEFLDNIPEGSSEEMGMDDFEEETIPGNLPVLEDLLEENTNEQISIGDGEKDDLLLVKEPMAVLGEEKESVAHQELEDLEDLEIEESLDGLFEEAIEVTQPASVPEEIFLETMEGLADLEGETTTDNALATDEGQIVASQSIEEIEASSIPAKDIPLEITNDEPPTDNVLEDLDAQPSPSPKTAFISYQQVQHHKAGLLDGGLKIFKKETKEITPAPIIPTTVEAYEEPEDVAKEVAASSLSEDNTIATETLAGILERQGHFDKAIKMYEKLSLQFPEKSSTFAAKIEKLRKK